jgi:cation diffusion facilitator CzcD-associated flavoprotein CzcO
VTAVQAHDQAGFLVHAATGQSWHAAGVVAATGSFGNPYVPALPGQDEFTGRLQHVASYRSPSTMPASAWSWSGRATPRSRSARAGRLRDRFDA